MKIPKLNNWSIEFSDYDLMFVQIKSSNNILAGAISRLKTLDIYEEPLYNPKTSHAMTHIIEIVTTDLQTISINKLYTKQKRDIHFRKLAVQSDHKNKNTFKAVIISPDGLLQKQQYLHGLNYDVTIAPWSVAPIIPHEFYASKGH